MADTTTVTTTSKKEKMVKLRLPLLRGESNADVFVSVNERNWLIKRGVEVEVPEVCAIELKQQEDALMKAFEYQQSVENSN